MVKKTSTQKKVKSPTCHICQQLLPANYYRQLEAFQVVSMVTNRKKNPWLFHKLIFRLDMFAHAHEHKSVDSILWVFHKLMWDM